LPKRKAGNEEERIDEDNNGKGMKVFRDVEEGGKRKRG
jgi:hypothetical protein